MEDFRIGLIDVDNCRRSGQVFGLDPNPERSKFFCPFQGRFVPAVKFSATQPGGVLWQARCQEFTCPYNGGPELDKEVRLRA